MKTLKNVSLYFKDERSNKEYHLQLVEANGGYIVNFQYGRRGSTLKGGCKTKDPLPLEKAQKIYDGIEREKISEGYLLGADKNNDFSSVNPETAKEVIILPQLLNAIDDVQEFIDSDEWLAQEKKDGERRMVICDGKNIKGYNKKGTEVPLPKSIIQSIDKSYILKCILDGEIIGDKLFVFDLLSIDDNDLKSLPCTERLGYLNALNFGEGIKFVFTSSSKVDKQKMFERLKNKNAEGIVFKKKDSAYIHGRPASGGTALKYKFTKTATFIVEGTTDGKRSVGLLLMDGKEKKFLGKVSIPANHAIPSEGSFIEVRYLYAYPNGAVFQPVYLGERFDCDLTDATVKQLIYKTETV